MDFEINKMYTRFDSRDIQQRTEELQSLGDDLTEEERSELNELLRVREEVDSGDWDYGMTFIAEWDFADYAKELANDLGLVSDSAEWPLYLIDWTAAARDLSMDYVSVRIKDTDFWVR